MEQVYTVPLSRERASKLCPRKDTSGEGDKDSYPGSRQAGEQGGLPSAASEQVSKRAKVVGVFGGLCFWT